jgi:hypothetical protein
VENVILFKARDLDQFQKPKEDIQFEIWNAGDLDLRRNLGKELRPICCIWETGTSALLLNSCMVMGDQTTIA